MISLIQIGPGSTTEQMINALNQNFQQLESLNRTFVMKDETGVNRIIIGKRPDGSWGLTISKPGIDVVKLYS